MQRCHLLALMFIGLLSAAATRADQGPATDLPTPPRLSLIEGQVSFWRPGGEDWAPARPNTPRDRLRSGKPLPIAEHWIGSAFSPTPLAFRRARTSRLSLRQPQVTQILSNYLLLFQSRTRP